MTVSSEYQNYPKVYVETEDTSKCEEVIIEINGKYKLTRMPIKGYKPKRIFCKKIYENIHDEVLDLESGIIKKSIIVYMPWKDKYYIVERGVRSALIEAKGYEVFFNIREGDKVKEKDKIGYVVSKKFEVRTIRSPVDGVIALISQDVTSRNKYILSVVGEEFVREIKVERED